eukprot:TRINITY_DN10138_c0_g1_i2.p1 TRINITY_DN10138_c0_g1~~TRINITY_DN10138_c0_g1_i2.p1  ORF type:complete len:705 (+),score=169.04 TRINITY_DN10138_c0_g1_i2:73-2187(+)
MAIASPAPSEGSASPSSNVSRPQRGASPSWRQLRKAVSYRRGASPSGGDGEPLSLPEQVRVLEGLLRCEKAKGEAAAQRAHALQERSEAEICGLRDQLRRAELLLSAQAAEAAEAADALAQQNRQLELSIVTKSPQHPMTPLITPGSEQHVRFGSSAAGRSVACDTAVCAARRAELHRQIDGLENRLAAEMRRRAEFEAIARVGQPETADAEAQVGGVAAIIEADLAEAMGGGAIPADQPTAAESAALDGELADRRQELDRLAALAQELTAAAAQASRLCSSLPQAEWDSMVAQIKRDLIRKYFHAGLPAPPPAVCAPPLAVGALDLAVGEHMVDSVLPAEDPVARSAPAVVELPGAASVQLSVWVLTQHQEQARAAVRCEAAEEGAALWRRWARLRQAYWQERRRPAPDCAERACQTVRSGARGARSGAPTTPAFFPKGAPFDPSEVAWLPTTPGVAMAILRRAGHPLPPPPDAQKRAQLASAVRARRETLAHESLPALDSVGTDGGTPLTREHHHGRRRRTKGSDPAVREFVRRIGELGAEADSVDDGGPSSRRSSLQPAPPRSRRQEGHRGSAAGTTLVSTALPPLPMPSMAVDAEDTAATPESRGSRQSAPRHTRGRAQQRASALAAPHLREAPRWSLASAAMVPARRRYGSHGGPRNEASGVLGWTPPGDNLAGTATSASGELDAWQRPPSPEALGPQR